MPIPRSFELSSSGHTVSAYIIGLHSLAFTRTRPNYICFHVLVNAQSVIVGPSTASVAYSESLST